MSAPAPRVSVGLPVYNGERYLREALDSILGQTYGNLELIVSDNASTDATEAICREYAARDPRVRYERQPENRGAVWNFNRVLELARGELFMWAAFDDRRRPEYLDRCVAALDAARDAVLCCTEVALIDEDGVPLEDPLWPPGIRPVGDTAAERAAAVARATFWYDFYGLMRARVLRDAGPARPVWGFDVVLTLEVVLRGAVVAVPEPLFEYRVFRRKTPQDLADTLAPRAQGGVAVDYTELSLLMVERALAAPLSRAERVAAAWRVYREFCLRNPLIRPNLETALARRGPSRPGFRRRVGVAALGLALHGDRVARGVSTRLRTRWERLTA